MEQLRDKNGRVIHVGDIVTFNFCSDCTPHHNCDCPKEETTMIDFVDTGENGELYFVSDLGLAAYAWRYNDHATIIGNMNDNPEIFYSQTLPRDSVETECVSTS